MKVFVDYCLTLQVFVGCHMEGEQKASAGTAAERRNFTPLHRLRFAPDATNDRRSKR